MSGARRNPIVTRDTLIHFNHHFFYDAMIDGRAISRATAAPDRLTS